jgi:hypothetical protein
MEYAILILLALGVVFYEYKKSKNINRPKDPLKDCKYGRNCSHVDGFLCPCEEMLEK